MNKFYMGILILASSTAQAWSPFHSEAEDARRLAEVLTPFVFSLDRDLVTYHYEVPRPGFDPRTVGDLNDHIAERADLFFDATKRSNYGAGPGAYLATDPGVSRNFGKADPLLFILTLRAGARLIDLSAKISAPVQAQIKSIFESACGPRPGSFADLDQLLFNFRLGSDGSASCLRVATGAFKQAGLQAIVYGWNASNALAGCRVRDQAINLVSTEALRRSATVLITKTRVLGGEPDLIARTGRLFDEAMNDVLIKGQRTDDPAWYRWFGPATATDDSGYARWKAERILTCGARWATEGDGRPDVMSQFNASFLDRSTQDLVLKASMAYHEKGDNGFPVPALRQNQIERLYFAMSGLPADRFDDWKRAKDILIDPSVSANAVAQATRLLGEPMAHPMNVGDFLKSHVDVTATDFHALQALLTEAGYGPRARQILAGHLLSHYFAAAPPLSAEAFAHFDDPATWRANRAAFRNLTSACLAVYLDPKVTIQQVDAGGCGRSAPDVPPF